MLSQHVINIKIIEMFYTFFYSESSKSHVILFTVHNSVRLFTFQVLNSFMYLVATVLGSAVFYFCNLVIVT